MQKRFSVPIKKLLLFILITLSSFDVKAWLYSEHRYISLLAIQRLNPAMREKLDFMWGIARKGYENRLGSDIINLSPDKTTTTIDYASWAAISGDHSCSPATMLYTVLNSNWILNVEHIAFLLGDRLANAKTKSHRINAQHLSDMQLLRADDEYASRAGSNSVHFLLPRLQSDTKFATYFDSCISKTANANAMATYSWFHASALIKANRYHTARNEMPENERNTLLRAALAEEAFAIHFLQDIFAAGHITGSWGSAAQKKGTHDYYNEAGLEIETWGGKRKVVKGDGNMREEDADFVAEMVGKSYSQFIEAFSGNWKTPLTNNQAGSNEPSGLDICNATHLPAQEFDVALLNEILIQTPIPGLGSGIGALARVNAELGPFIGLSTSLDGSFISGGFGTLQRKGGFIGGMEANGMIGVGLDGVLSASGDGLAFLQIGYKYEGPSSNNFYFSDPTGSPNAITSAITARSAITMRVRLPFFAIPGDLILASPLYLISPKTYTRMAESAVNGGGLGIQHKIATPAGSFQFLFGREIALSFYGLIGPKDYLIIPTDPLKTSLVQFKSTKLTMPVFEYIPTRSFSQKQTSSLIIQFNVGVDIPYQSSVLLPSDPLPELKNVYQMGIRVLFNLRRYM